MKDGRGGGWGEGGTKLSLACIACLMHVHVWEWALHLVDLEGISGYCHDRPSERTVTERMRSHWIPPRNPTLWKGGLSVERRGRGDTCMRWVEVAFALLQPMRASRAQGASTGGTTGREGVIVMPRTFA